MTKILDLFKKAWFRILLFFLVICIVSPIILLAKFSSSYNDACAYENEGNYYSALPTFAKLGNYRDSREKTISLLVKGNCHAIAAGENHMLVIGKGGNVVASGDNSSGQCNTENWTDVVSVAAGDKYSIGLKSDGTVLFAGDPQKAPILTSGISAIAAGGNTYALLKDDMTVYVSTDRLDFDVSQWKNIISVAAAQNMIVGLRSDGKTEALGVYSSDIQRYKKVNLMQVSPHAFVCIKTNGRSYTNNELFNMIEWPEVSMIATGYSHTVAVAESETGEKDIKFAGSWISSEQGHLTEWTDVVALAAGNAFTVGLTEDGMIRATGKNDFGQCDLNNQNINDLT